MNFKIGTRMGIGFALMIALVSVVGILGCLNLKKLANRDAFLYTNTAEPIGACADIQNRLWDIRNSIYEMALDTSKENIQQQIKDIGTDNDTIVELVRLYTESYIDAKDSMNLMAFKASYLAWYQNDVEPVKKSFSENKVAEAKATIAAQQVDIDKLFDNFNALINYNVASGKKVSDENTSVANSVITQMIVICLIAAIVGILLGMFLTRLVTKPIKLTTEMLKDIAQGEGDLTKRLVPQGSDEIADLCNWFNTFVVKIQGVVGQIANSTDTLASASEELSATSMQIAASAEETSCQSTAVASASEQASVNLQQISSATQQVSQTIHSIVTAIEEMSSSLSVVSQSCQEELSIANGASNQAETVQANMEQLGDVAKQVEKIIDVISYIADQTNLLALNATIEAASAGEAGKGFAVVAGEVKELARQTAQATTDIGDQIRKMQASTNTAITSIQGIVAVISQVNATSQSIVTAVAEQTSTINALSKSVSTVGVETNSITFSVTESGKGLKEIASNIAKVNQATNGTASGITQINASTENLAKLASQLDQIVHQFKV